jgi:DNA-binding MarR family transcriptional regulator
VKLETALKSTKFTSPTQKSILNILYTAWWLKTLHSAAFKPFDITQEQYNVLRILKGTHPQKMSIKDIASRLIEKNSNVPRIIDKLEIKKFVERLQCPLDGRHSKINLTQNGIDTLLQATIALENIIKTTINITAQEAETLSNILEKIRENEQ